MSIYFESAENIMNKIATHRNFNVTYRLGHHSKKKYVSECENEKFIL